MASGGAKPKSSEKYNLRSSSATYLLGEEVTDILGSKLPSKKQVLGFFIHSHFSKSKLSLRDCAKLTFTEVIKFWVMARIPTKEDYHCYDQIIELYEKWQDIKKHRDRRTPAQIKKEEIFVDEMDDLFDIAHANAMTKIKIPQDKMFLQLQRQKGRVGSMSGIDKKTAKTDERKEQRDAYLRQEREKVSQSETASSSRSNAIAGNVDVDNDCSDPDFVIQQTPLPKVNPRESKQLNKQFIDARYLWYIVRVQVHG